MNKIIKKTKQCRFCKTNINNDATVCPHCGRDQIKIGKSSMVMLIGLSCCTVGFILTILLITAPIGIPLILIGVILALSGSIGEVTKLFRKKVQKKK